MPTKCNSCGGTYTPAQSDGSRYFHACPPIANPAYQPDPTKPLFNLQQTIEHPAKRDENFAAPTGPGQPPQIIAAGTGVTVV